MIRQHHVDEVAKLYDDLAANGPYGTLAPSNRGGRKSRYVAEVFDAALFHELAGESLGDKVLLDFGCGTGIFAVRAAHLFDRVLALDVSEEMLNWGRRLAPGNERITWMLGDGERIALGDGEVDWVVARESLCYVPSAQLPSMISEIARVMRPGGCFLWLEQTSDDPKFQANPNAPLLEKRPVDQLIGIAADAGLLLDAARCVRTPRFPWIYPVWFGLLPSRLTPWLARAEVAWHRRFSRLRGNRWRDVLLRLRKPA